MRINVEKFVFWGAKGMIFRLYDIRRPVRWSCVLRVVGGNRTLKVISPTLGGEGCCVHGLALRAGFRVGEICQELGCSERYLRAVFIRDVGFPPKEWIRQERMFVARQLLDAGETPAAVAEVLGFASVGNFRRAMQLFQHQPDKEEINGDETGITGGCWMTDCNTSAENDQSAARLFSMSSENRTRANS